MTSTHASSVSVSGDQRSPDVVSNMALAMGRNSMARSLPMRISMSDSIHKPHSGGGTRETLSLSCTRLSSALLLQLQVRLHAFG